MKRHVQRLIPYVNVAFFLLLAIIRVGYASARAPQQEPCSNPCGKPTAWQEFNSFELKVSASGQPESYLYNGRFDKDTDDLAVEVEESKGGSIAKGKILMIGGRIMATQGPIVEPGYEIDTLDGAVLELQLVEKALGRAFPNGPTSIQASQHVDYSDPKTGIQIATPSADGMIQPPWHLVGELKREGSGVVEYQLTLISNSGEGHGKQTNTVTFSGKLFNATQTKIDDQLSLDSWTLYGLGPQSRKQGNSTIIDYSAAPTTATYKTVADIRKKLQADDYPGELDPTKDFTGFWKTKCEDAFGLQIKHFGTDGKYSIVFCGPGGCGDPANEGRKTFITKDPHFQVISEDEFKAQGGDGWEIWHRCTRDTHPVLKYRE